MTSMDDKLSFDAVAMPVLKIVLVAFTLLIPATIVVCLIYGLETAFMFAATAAILIFATPLLLFCIGVAAIDIMGFVSDSIPDVNSAFFFVFKEGDTIERLLKVLCIVAVLLGSLRIVITWPESQATPKQPHSSVQPYFEPSAGKRFVTAIPPVEPESESPWLLLPSGVAIPIGEGWDEKFEEFARAIKEAEGRSDDR